jgi:hypothetical protein
MYVFSSDRLNDRTVVVSTAHGHKLEKLCAATMACHYDIISHGFCVCSSFCAPLKAFGVYDPLSSTAVAQAAAADPSSAAVCRICRARWRTTAVFWLQNALNKSPTLFLLVRAACAKCA